MAVKVQKFGGSSLGSLKHIRRCAKIVKEAYKTDDIVVVVSAMGNQTDSLVDYIDSFNVQDNASSDVVLSAGEQISCGLFALALRELNIKAITLLGWQIPIQTDAIHSTAKILSIDVTKIKEYLNEKYVVVVPGFQGVYNDKITTLGRGGSDITAAALANSLGALRCEIFKDVVGVFSSDPHREPGISNHLPKVGYSQLLEMSLEGNVIHKRAVDISMRSCSSLIIKSSLEPESTLSTQIVDKIEMLQKPALTFKRDLCLLSAPRQSILGLLRKYSIAPESLLGTGNNLAAIVKSSEQEKILDRPSDVNLVKELFLITIVGSSLLTSYENVDEIMSATSQFRLWYCLTTEIKITLAFEESEFEKVRTKIIEVVEKISTPAEHRVPHDVHSY